MPQKQRIRIADGYEADLMTLETLIIGSGAAALNCAEHLHELGAGDYAIVTDRLGAGTSNNSGSDKQTYYKLGIFGDVPDSPIEFAHSLFDGGMMHGDLAYIEALGSAPEFFHLVRNGVKFPYNRYGAFVGYKTDHDPRQRATSAGPRTSMQMFSRSLKQVRRNGAAIFDRHEVIALLTSGEGDEKRVRGALALKNGDPSPPEERLVVFNCENIVMATGGPGEMYATSVYPRGQIGSHGLALEIGAIANNLGESQYGLASTSFRWNLSGTYQQVIPCYYSTDPDGGDVRYFLNDYFHDMGRLASNIFLKGYQWPFDASRLQDMGSSVIDYAVFNETDSGRLVWMDFRRNPQHDKGMEPFSLDLLSKEAADYLGKSGASQDTPIERLRHMNAPAIDIYRDNGIDLASEPIPVAVCAQHSNGGLRGDIWWESNIKHLFPIGEVNGSHGVRPGGSALNSGQVGGLRAAQYIASVYNGAPPGKDEFLSLCRPELERRVKDIQRHQNAGGAARTNRSVRTDIQSRMTRHGAFLRSGRNIGKALNEAKMLYRALQKDGIRADEDGGVATAFQNEHLCLTHIAFLETIQTYIAAGGGSRGAYVIEDPQGRLEVETKKGKELPHRPENEAMKEEILETQRDGNGAQFRVEAVHRRPLPEDDSWYETVWRRWREGDIFD